MGLMSSINVNDDDKTTVKSTGSFGAFDTKPKEEVKEERTLPISLFSPYPVSRLYDVKGTQVPAGVITEAGEGIATGVKVGIPAVPFNLVSFGNFLNDLVADYGQYAGMPGATASFYAKSLQPHFNKLEKFAGRESFNNIIVNSKLGEIFDITEEDLKNPAALVGELLVTMPITALDKGRNLTTFRKQFNPKEFAKRVDDFFNNLKYADSPEFATANGAGVSSTNRNLISQSNRLFNMSDDTAKGGGSGGVTGTILSAEKGPNSTFTVSAKVLEVAKKHNNRSMDQINKSPILTKNLLDTLQAETTKQSRNLINGFLNSSKYSSVYGNLPENTKAAKKQDSPVTLDQFISDLQTYIQPMKPVSLDFQTAASKSLAYGANVEEGTGVTLSSLDQSNYVVMNNTFERDVERYQSKGYPLGQNTHDSIALIKRGSQDLYTNEGIKIPFSEFGTTIKPTGGVGDEADFAVQQNYYKHPSLLGPGKTNETLILGTVLTEADRAKFLYKEPDTTGLRIGHYRGHDRIILSPRSITPSYALEISKHFNYRDAMKNEAYPQDVSGTTNLKNPIGFLEYYKQLYSKDNFNFGDTWTHRKQFKQYPAKKRVNIYNVEPFMVQKINNILDTFDIPMPLFNKDVLESFEENARFGVLSKNPNRINELTVPKGESVKLLDKEDANLPSPQFVSRLKQIVKNDIEENKSMMSKFKNYGKDVLTDEEFTKFNTFLNSVDTNMLESVLEDYSIAAVNLPPMFPVKNTLTSEKYKELYNLIKQDYNLQGARLLNELNQYIASWMSNYVHSSLGSDIFESQYFNLGNRYLESVLDEYNIKGDGWRKAPFDGSSDIGSAANILVYPHEYFNSNQVNRNVKTYSATDFTGDGDIPLGENFQQAMLDYINKSSQVDFGASPADINPVAVELAKHFFEMSRKGVYTKEEIKNILEKVNPVLEEPDLQKVISLMEKDKEINKNMFAFIKENSKNLFPVDKRTGVRISATSDVFGDVDAGLATYLQSNKQYPEISDTFKEDIKKWEELGGKSIYSLPEKLINVNKGELSGAKLNKNNQIVIGENRLENFNKAIKNWGSMSRVIVEMQNDPLKPDEARIWKNAVASAKREVADGGTDDQVKKLYLTLSESGWINGDAQATIDFVNGAQEHKDYLRKTLETVNLNDVGKRNPLTPSQLEVAIASIKYLDGFDNNIDTSKLTAGERYYASLAQNSEKQMQAQVLSILDKAEQDGITEVLFPDGATAAKIQGWKSNILPAEKAPLFALEYKNASPSVKSFFNSLSSLKEADFVPNINQSGYTNLDDTGGLHSFLPLTHNLGSLSNPAGVIKDSLFSDLLKRHLYYKEGSKINPTSGGQMIYSPFVSNERSMPINYLISNTGYQKAYDDAIEKYAKVATIAEDKASFQGASGQTHPVFTRPIFPFELYMFDKTVYDKDFMGDGTRFIKALQQNDNVADRARFRDGGKNLDLINDTFIQPVLLDMAYLASKGYLFRGGSTTLDVDFDALKNTVLPSNYFDTKNNFKASTNAKEEDFVELMEHMRSPNMINSIIHLYDQSIAENLLTTIFYDKLKGSLSYNIFGKSSIDKEKLYDIVEEKLQAPFENAYRIYKNGLATKNPLDSQDTRYTGGKYIPQEVLSDKPLRVPSSFKANQLSNAVRIKFKNVHVQGHLIDSLSVFRQDSKKPWRYDNVYLPPTKEWSADIDDATLKIINKDEMVKLDRWNAIQVKSSFIDSVAAVSKKQYYETPPQEAINNMYLRTKKYGKLAATYGKDIPKTLKQMGIPFTTGQESGLVSKPREPLKPLSLYDYFRKDMKYANAEKRFYRVNVKEAKKAIKSKLPEIFSLGGVLGAPALAERLGMFDEREEDPTIPLL